MMNTHKFFMSLTILFLLNLSKSFSTEMPMLETETSKFLSFSAWKRSQSPQPPAEEIAQIDKKTMTCKIQLERLTKLHKASDTFWDTLDKFQIESGPIILFLCNNHEKIFREIYNLNEEIRDLEQTKKELTGGETGLNEVSLNMDHYALVPKDIVISDDDSLTISFP